MAPTAGSFKPIHPSSSWFLPLFLPPLCPEWDHSSSHTVAFSMMASQMGFFFPPGFTEHWWEQQGQSKVKHFLLLDCTNKTSVIQPRGLSMRKSEVQRKFCYQSGSNCSRSSNWGTEASGTVFLPNLQSVFGADVWAVLVSVMDNVRAGFTYVTLSLQLEEEITSSGQLCCSVVWKIWSRGGAEIQFWLSCPQSLFF